MQIENNYSNCNYDEGTQVSLTYCFNISMKITFDKSLSQTLHFLTFQTFKNSLSSMATLKNCENFVYNINYK